MHKWIIGELVGLLAIAIVLALGEFIGGGPAIAVAALASLFAVIGYVRFKG